MLFTRYAIYYTPAPGPLADFGASWLGWNAANGTSLPPPRTDCLPMAWEEIVATPRKYGFHGTIKPPFRLAPDQQPRMLRDALADFCASRSAVELAGLELAQLGRFLALVPIGDTSDLSRRAADAVRAFDQFRAPPDAREIARRQTGALRPRQNTLLETWGYPYVMDEFRFHLTLSGKLPKAHATRLRATLAPLITPLLTSPHTIDALSLMGEDTHGMFHLIERIPFSGSD